MLNENKSNEDKMVDSSYTEFNGRQNTHNQSSRQQIKKSYGKGKKTVDSRQM